MKITELDLTKYSAVKPGKPIHLLFIHHLAGGHLMASPGIARDECSIVKTHPNAGGLRAMLTENNYITHEASLGSKIGEEIDVCHWNRKFLDQMDRLIRTRHQGMLHNDDTRNRVIMFQSGASSNWIEADGIEPGNPDSGEKTLANYKAAYRSLLDYFRNEPETLFIALTAPPLAKPEQMQGLISRIMGKSSYEEIGKRARVFNNWLSNIHSGWLKDYPLKNVVVFDYYDILTAGGVSNWLKYPSGTTRDSLPSARGNQTAALEFIPFINRARNRLVQPSNRTFISRYDAVQSMSG